MTKILLICAIVMAVCAAWWLQQPQGRAALAGMGRGADVQAQGSTPAAAPQPALIEVTQAVARTLRDEVQAVGTLVSRQSTAISPEVSGRVTAIRFSDGQRVRKGQQLLQLDDRLERAQLQQAEAELALARANHQRNSELVARGFISQAALDESAANLQVAQARRALAQTSVERLRVRAPFDAVAGIGNVHVGDYLSQGDAVVQLQDMDVLYVDFRLPERLSSALQLGQQVQLRVDALAQEVFSATVVAIDPLIDAQGRSVALRASLPNDGHRLRPGMFARVSLLLDAREGAVLVPEQAILAGADGDALIRVVPWDAADRAADLRSLPPDAPFRSERVAVELGQRLPGWVEVRHGVAAGDVVMTAGQHRVSQSDQQVRVRWAPSPPEPAVVTAVAAGAGD
ncbi:efflux RND transporter periplasmic adaptor subunit [Lampropedia cohaerens]|uniref:efflux RND transporter periplasmic adaptor subunit n=1 Tax=Lampropedia cohaerens TaxID=1610491 RepID=UPI0018D254BC|nr:efflux RND transporter periplasmic adaptor subunit [Lampropedia cohaerens]